MSHLTVSPSAAWRNTKTAERVAALIVDTILAQRLAPGTMLPSEAAMLETYGVSRSSLREALRILEVNGLLRLRSGPRGGPVVGSADPTTFGRTMALFLRMSNTKFADLMDARVTVEPLMARLAAERKDPARLQQLEESLEAHRDLDPSNELEYIRVVQDFHAVVAGLSGNPVLDLFGRALKEISTQRMLDSHQPPARWSAIKREHEGIANAILTGDASTAEQLMASHMHEFSASFSRRYRGLLEETVNWVP